MITALGLTRRFGDKTAVDRIDIEIKEPGVIGLLGPNGAGKTTTMRMLAGSLAMTDGAATVAGFDLFERPLQVKARVGYLPEVPPLYTELTVGEYLQFVAAVRGVPKGRRKLRVGSVLETVGLKGMERKTIDVLSKGYRQRVGLAQALVHDPRLLILDEPTSGLDPVQMVPIRALIKSLAKERVVLISTHVLAEVEALCDRVIVLNQGRIVGDGTPAELGRKHGLTPWVELHLRGDAKGLNAALCELDSVEGISHLGAGPGEHRYRLIGGSEMLPKVVGLAVSSGFEVLSARHHAPSLQDLFLGLMGPHPGAREE